MKKVSPQLTEPFTKHQNLQELKIDKIERHGPVSSSLIRASDKAELIQSVWCWSERRMKMSAIMSV